jgi:hypothetical protein
MWLYIVMGLGGDIMLRMLNERVSLSSFFFRFFLAYWAIDL